MRHRDRKVLLIAMPWYYPWSPSLGLGILKSTLLDHGIPCDVLYATMELLRYVKLETYAEIGSLWAMNEFTFTRVFEDAVSDTQRQAVLKALEDPHEGAHTIGVEDARGAARSRNEQFSRLMRLRQEIVPQFLNDLMESIDFSRYVLVGFTCLYGQTIPSLSLARLIRRRYPDVLLALGGACVCQPVGSAIQRSFPEIDAVAYGDGEPVIVPLFEAACGEREFAEVPNITYRDRSGAVVESDSRCAIELDRSPTPNYDDYFENMATLSRDHKIHLTVGPLPIESSRGCLWAQKVGCTFCSVTEQDRVYRTKSGDRTLGQMTEIAERYKGHLSWFAFTDLMMPVQSFTDLLPKLESRGAPYMMTCSIRPNLTWEQIGLCSRSGLFMINPGIENFSTSTLQLMKKGTTAIRNIFTVFAATFHRLLCFYNFIWGFPGERSSDYMEMAKRLPRLSHLIPPVGERPLMLVQHAELARRFPSRPHYRHDALFSPDFVRNHGVAMEDICYRYDEDEINHYAPDLLAMYRVIQRQIANWRTGFFGRKNRLSYATVNDGLVVRDERFAAAKVYHLQREHAELSDVLFGRVVHEGTILNEMSDRGFAPDISKQALGTLCEIGITMTENGEYVWIAFPDSYYEDDLAWLSKTPPKWAMTLQ